MCDMAQQTHSHGKNWLWMHSTPTSTFFVLFFLFFSSFPLYIAFISSVDKFPEQRQPTKYTLMNCLPKTIKNNFKHIFELIQTTSMHKEQRVIMNKVQHMDFLWAEELKNCFHRIIWWKNEQYWMDAFKCIIIAQL